MFFSPQPACFPITHRRCRLNRADAHGGRLKKSDADFPQKTAGVLQIKQQRSEDRN